MRTRDDRRSFIIRELLIQCSEDKYPEMTDDRFFLVSVTAAVISANMDDLNSQSDEIRQQANEYLESARFHKHCTILGIDAEIIIHIALNQDKQLTTLGHYHQDDVYLDIAGVYNEGP